MITTIVGIVHWNTDPEKTGGIHINLWVGLSMLVGGLLFFLWDRLNPVPAEDIIGQAEAEVRWLDHVESSVARYRPKEHPAPVSEATVSDAAVRSAR
ncbi:hypothetical protein IAE22_27690 [Bacillus sp. S34]|nr:hypothetical protein [Bacillus sp. S34]